MRSSKSRSRSKSNRPRTLGNITNRVFDSSGPEGKVRGTPQQIIDKYNQLSRDAQLSNDRVNAENFLQHAEHYTRMLGEAMREMQAEQEQRRQHDNQNNQGQNNQGGNQQRDYQQRDRGGDQQPDLRDDRNDGGRDEGGRDEQRDDRNDNRRDNRNDNRNNGPRDDRNEGRRDAPRDNRNDTPREDRGNNPRNRHVPRNEDAAVSAVIDNKPDEDDTGLVETPETRRPRQPRNQRVKPADDTGNRRVEAAEQPVAAQPDAEPLPEKPRKPRAPRKPKPEAEAADGSGNQAAE